MKVVKVNKTLTIEIHEVIYLEETDLKNKILTRVLVSLAIFFILKRIFYLNFIHVFFEVINFLGG
ncbi:MAG: hypothetical protein KAW12_07110 [Candidatus Aminicenantes bacterium]|nr:hypothetical protein [Candidatus Aminicenantes bacterium]